MVRVRVLGRLLVFVRVRVRALGLVLVLFQYEYEYEYSCHALAMLWPFSGHDLATHLFAHVRSFLLIFARADPGSPLPGF